MGDTRAEHRQLKKVRVWDILNCGPRERFTVEGLLVHNCAILDFGGNVLRHGPVDAIRIEAPDHRGNGEAPAKQCPECQSLIAAGYTTCPDCGYEFPPRERQPHTATASTAGILSGAITTTPYEVEAVSYFVHRKRGAPDDAPRTLHVKYQIGFRKYQSEWICFEHTGWARYRAESWWRRRSDAPVPDSAAEAADLANFGVLAETRFITVRTVVGEEYARIIGYELGPKPPWDGGDEQSEMVAIASQAGGMTASDSLPF